MPAMMLQTTNAASTSSRAAGAFDMTESIAEPDWSAFYSPLQRFVAGRVRSAADTDDLVQLVLERAVSKQARAGEIENVTAWLLAIARNAVVDFQRAAHRSRPGSAPDEVEPAHEPFSKSSQDREDVLACVRPLLNMLPEETQQLLCWADVDERPLQSIADELGISLTATKSRVQRARKAFIEVAQRCCTVTLDARGRVSALSPRRHGCDPCDSSSTSRPRKS
jgi:RNA polymerase sigma-70 factor (ECF subfamily)